MLKGEDFIILSEEEVTAIVKLIASIPPLTQWPKERSKNPGAAMIFGDMKRWLNRED